MALAHELGVKGIHVAHLVIDGPIVSPDTLGKYFPAVYQQILDANKGGKQAVVDPADVAKAYWFLWTQNPSAWTFELDLRPWNQGPWWGAEARL